MVSFSGGGPRTMPGPKSTNPTTASAIVGFGKKLDGFSGTHDAPVGRAAQVPYGENRLLAHARRAHGGFDVVREFHFRRAELTALGARCQWTVKPGLAFNSQ
jgi:hypothetical protein